MTKIYKYKSPKGNSAVSRISFEHAKARALVMDAARCTDCYNCDNHCFNCHHCDGCEWCRDCKNCAGCSWCNNLEACNGWENGQDKWELLQIEEEEEKLKERRKACDSLNKKAESFISEMAVVYRHYESDEEWYERKKRKAIKLIKKCCPIYFYGE